MDEWKTTVDTSVARFARFTGFLHKEGLMDKAVEHLRKNNLGQIRISHAHIKALQQMIKDHFGDNLSEEAKQVIASEHVRVP